MVLLPPGLIAVLLTNQRNAGFSLKRLNPKSAITCCVKSIYPTIGQLPHKAQALFWHLACSIPGMSDTHTEIVPEPDTNRTVFVLMRAINAVDLGMIEAARELLMRELRRKLYFQFTEHTSTAQGKPRV